MNTPASVGVLAHPHPVAEQRPAGERRRRVDASTPTRLPARAQRGDQRGRGGRLADPGWAGQPDDVRAPGVRGESGDAPRAAAGWRSSTSEISRATARCSPSRARGDQLPGTPQAPPASPAVRTRHADDQRVALAAAAAQRRGADAAAAALQLERQVQGDPGAGHADRVAQRDGAAVDVDLVLVDAQLAGRDEPDRGERLVDLDEVEVGRARCPPSRRPCAIALAGCSCRLASGPATTPCAPISASQVRPSSSALALLITTTAAAPSEICDAEPAVIVPSEANAGRSLPRLSAVVSPRMPSSVVNVDRVALALRDLTGAISSAKIALLGGRGGALVRARGELVLLRPRQLVAAVVLLGRGAHRDLVERAEQAVVGHVVDHRHVAVLEALAGLAQQVRRLGHRLLAAGDDDVELARRG